MTEFGKFGRNIRQICQLSLNFKKTQLADHTVHPKAKSQE